MTVIFALFMFSACCDICFIVGYKSSSELNVYCCHVQYVPTLNNAMYKQLAIERIATDI